MGIHGLRSVFVPAFGPLLATLLGGCPTVDLGDTPEDILQCNPPGGIDYFTSVIYPVYLKGDDKANAMSCTQDRGCHQMGDGTPFNLLTGAQKNDQLNFKATQQFLNCGTEEMSPLLTRPLDTMDPHGGGDIFGEGTEQFDAFIGWFQ